LKTFNRIPKINEKVYENIIYNLLSGNIIFLQIKSKAIKKELIKRIIKQLKSQRRIFYLDCKKIGQDPNIKKIFQKRYFVVGKLFNIQPKNMVVLIDNLKYMSSKNSEKIKYYFDQDNIKSVMFIGENYDTVRLSPSTRHRIGKRVFKI